MTISGRFLAVLGVLALLAVPGFPAPPAPGPRIPRLTLGAGLQITRIQGLRPAKPAAAGTVPTPPLEGPLIRVAVTATDQRLAELEFETTAHAGLTGRSLSPNTNVVYAILDSGAATHLINYPAGSSLGLRPLHVTANPLTVEGVTGDQIDLDLSQPVGFFTHGLQDLSPEGRVTAERLSGLGNFVAGVDTQANHDEFGDIPSVLGAPLFAYFAAVIRNSEPVTARMGGVLQRSPSVTFFSDPDDAAIPTLAHRVYLAARPTATPLAAQYYSLDFETFEPSTPSVIGLAGSLFFTYSDVIVKESDKTTRKPMMFDTGAQATLLSRIAATELRLDLQHPEFEVDVQGIGGVITAPGCVVDELQVFAEGGWLVWTNVPVVVLNVASPEGDTLQGILGMNLFGDRDLVVNGIATPAYLDVSDPVVSPSMRLTAARQPSNDVVAMDWDCMPAPGRLVLQANRSDTLDPAAWMPASTVGVVTLSGTLSVTGNWQKAFFRLTAE